MLRLLGKVMKLYLILIFTSLSSYLNAQEIKVCSADVHLQVLHWQNDSKPLATSLYEQKLEEIERQVEGAYFQQIQLSPSQCKKAMEQGQVHATFTPFEHAFSAHLYFPDGQQYPNPDAAFTTVKQCFYGSKKFADFWPQRHIVQAQGMAAAVPSHLELTPDLSEESVFELAVFDRASAVRVFDNQRVQAILEVCQVQERAITKAVATQNTSILIDKPINEYAQYLAFSRSFYESNQALVERIWQQLAR